MKSRQNAPKTKSQTSLHMASSLKVLFEGDHFFFFFFFSSKEAVVFPSILHLFVFLVKEEYWLQCFRDNRMGLVWFFVS